MTNYYYQYTATSEFLGFGLKLSDSYATSTIIASILIGILALALVVFTALTIKRARPLGIIVAIAQPIGLFAAAKTVLSFADIDFSALDITVNGSSQANAMDKLYEAMGEAFMEKIFPQMLTFFFWCIVLAVVTILTLVYIILLIKAKSKVFAIFAMILVIARHFLISPIEMISLFLGSASQDIQSLWDFVFRFVFILPLILIAIQGLINLLNKKKEAAAPAVETAEASEPAVEAPVAEAIVSEESVAEAAATEELEAQQGD